MSETDPDDIDMDMEPWRFPNSGEIDSVLAETLCTIGIRCTSTGYQVLEWYVNHHPLNRFCSNISICCKRKSDTVDFGYKFIEKFRMIEPPEGEPVAHPGGEWSPSSPYYCPTCHQQTEDPYPMPCETWLEKKECWKIVNSPEAWDKAVLDTVCELRGEGTEWVTKQVKKWDDMKIQAYLMNTMNRISRLSWVIQQRDGAGKGNGKGMLDRALDQVSRLQRSESMASDSRHVE